jgi:K(+)-stimulated pyrophosphate-energized sodium pump
MNLVSLLIAPAVVKLTVGHQENSGARAGIAVVAALIIVAAVVNSKRKDIAVGDQPAAGTKPADAAQGQVSTL